MPRFTFADGRPNVAAPPRRTAVRAGPPHPRGTGTMIWELIPRTTEGSAAVEFVEVLAEVAANDPAYSAKMCPQPVELILEAMSEMLPDPKRKRRRAVQPFKRAVFIPVMMPRPREHRSAPRREGGARAGSSASGDDGCGGSSDPPPRCGPRAAVIPQSELRAPRVRHGHGRARQ
jgi:hypothetical protein